MVARRRKLWEMRKHPRMRPIFDNGTQLFNACVEYFKWVEENPLEVEELQHYKGRTKRVKTYKRRVMTFEGLYVTLGIDGTTWINWRKDERFKVACAEVDHIIREDKFSGAAGGLYNANLIARDLGLSEKTEVKSKAVTLNKDMSPQDAARAYQDLMNESD